MTSKQTLFQEIQQLLYTHAPQMPYKHVFLATVKKWEDKYVARINELESEPLVSEFNRMVSEGGSSTVRTRSERVCDCLAIKKPPCHYCTMTDEEYEDYEMRGSRYGSD